MRWALKEHHRGDRGPRAQPTRRPPLLHFMEALERDVLTKRHPGPLDL